MNSWCKENFIHLNSDKTQALQYALRNSTLINPNLSVNNSPIKTVSQAKYLGVILDSKLSWGPHITYLLSKLNSLCFLVRSLRCSVNIDVLLQLYHGSFQSHLLYGLLFWGNATNSHKVFVLQKRCVRIIAGAHPCAPSLPIFKAFQILPLPCLYIFSVVSFIHSNISLFPTNSVLHNHFTRSSTHLHLAYHRTKISFCGPKSIGFRLYNKLPIICKNSTSLSMFKSRVRSFLLNKMYYNFYDFLNDVI